MAHCGITSSKKRSNEKIQNESHAHRFFRCQGGGILCICPWGVNSEWCYLPRSAKKTEEKGQTGEASHRRKLEFASRQRSQPHLPQGWHKTASRQFTNSLTVPIWPKQIFFYSQNWNSPFKGHHHGTLSAVKEACTRTLKDLPESANQGAFDSWKSHWRKCVDAQLWRILRFCSYILNKSIFPKLFPILFIQPLYIHTTFIIRVQCSRCRGPVEKNLISVAKKCFIVKS